MLRAVAVSISAWRSCKNSAVRAAKPLGDASRKRQQCFIMSFSQHQHLCIGFWINCERLMFLYCRNGLRQCHLPQNVSTSKLPAGCKCFQNLSEFSNGFKDLQRIEVALNFFMSHSDSSSDSWIDGQKSRFSRQTLTFYVTLI